MHPGLDGAVALFGDSQQLDAETQVPGVAEVPTGQAGNALAVDVLWTHPTPKGQRGQYRQLVAGVDSFDVVLRVGLGVAELLRPFQRRGEVDAFPGHPGEDVVGGAVDDGEDTADFIGHQVMLQRGDEGDAPADAGLVLEADPVLPGQGQQFQAVLGDYLLVGGDGVLAAGDSPLEVVQCRSLSADGLDDNIYTGLVEKTIVVGGEKPARQLPGQRAREVRRQRLDFTQHQGAADLLREVAGPLREDPGYLSGYHPQADYSHADAILAHACLPNACKSLVTLSTTSAWTSPSRRVSSISAAD